ncbi:MAG: hypothetical protein WDA08_11145 [Weeksellaceae bacterium]|nr:hypothetical protein [Acholeplasmataceae bacterium]
MKTKIVLFVCLLFSVANSQNILNDQNIVYHHKRMVYEEWAEMLPKPKKFLGVTTNAAYWFIWGMFAPQRNKDYKGGPDIRPLKPTGHETMRFMELKLQQNYAEQIKAHADTLTEQTTREFLYWTSTTVDVDPLWLLYYRKKLKPISEFPDNPQTWQEWKFEDEDSYNLASQYGSIENLRIQLELVKSKYYQSRHVSMPRGKRILMYHETLLDWRKFLLTLNQNAKKYKNHYTALNKIPDNYDFAVSVGNKSDKLIVSEVMHSFKHKF